MDILVIITTTISKSFQSIIHYKSILLLLLFKFYFFDMFVPYSLSALIQCFCVFVFCCLSYTLFFFLKKILLGILL
jgi:hypothetical protein